MTSGDTPGAAAPAGSACTTSLVQQALGPAWAQLPPALQAHHGAGSRLEEGRLDVDFPAFMGPVLWAVSALGALVCRRGQAVHTRVQRRVMGEQLQWQRTLHYADGQVLRFNSSWAAWPGGQLVEWVNPWLGLRLQPFVQGQQLHFRGVCLVLRLAGCCLPLPQGLGLGHTTIQEVALDAHRVAMDFRLTHPLFGQLFRYAGIFRVDDRA